jgi:hypothetical protein
MQAFQFQIRKPLRLGTHGLQQLSYFRTAAMNDNMALIWTVSRNNSWWLIGGTNSWGSQALNLSDWLRPLELPLIAEIRCLFLYLFGLPTL